MLDHTYPAPAGVGFGLAGVGDVVGRTVPTKPPGRVSAGVGSAMVARHVANHLSSAVARSAAASLRAVPERLACLIEFQRPRRISVGRRSVPHVGRPTRSQTGRRISAMLGRWPRRRWTVINQSHRGASGTRVEFVGPSVAAALVCAPAPGALSAATPRTARRRCGRPKETALAEVAITEYLLERLGWIGSAGAETAAESGASYVELGKESSAAGRAWPTKQRPPADTAGPRRAARPSGRSGAGRSPGSSGRSTTS